MTLYTSAFCVPCHAARRVVAEVRVLLPGLEVEEVDVAARPDRAEAQGIRSTPTIVLSAGDREVLRAAGAPTAPQLLQAVARALDAAPDAEDGAPGPAGAA